MYENRHLRAALRARAEAGKNIALYWKQRAAAVERGEFGVTVSLEDGACSRRRCWSPPRGAIRRPARRRGSASRGGNMTMPRSSRRCATNCRTTRSPRNLLSRGAVRLAADERRCRGAPLGDRVVGRGGRCAGDAVAERRRLRRRGRGGDGRLPGQGRDDRAARVVAAGVPPCRADHVEPARAGRRRGARGASDRRAGRQSGLSRRRRAGAGAGRRGAARARPWRPAIARPLPGVARDRHLHGRAGHRHADADLRGQGQDREPGAALRHGADRPHRPGQGPADGRSARHERGLAACCCAGCRC